MKLFAKCVLFLLCVGILAGVSEKIISQENKDNKLSSVNFSIKHFGYTVNGKFCNIITEYKCLPDNLNNSFINVIIPIKYISTNHKVRDKNLLEENFFDIKKYPNAYFSSTKIERKSNYEYIIYGNLTIKEVTKKVQITLKKTDNLKINDGIVLKAEFKINRNDFNIGTDYWMAKMCIGEEVYLSAEIVVNNKFHLISDVD